MAKPKHAWMVRAGNDNELAELVEPKGAVAIGWTAMGDVSGLQTREEFKARYREAHPDDSARRVPVNAGQILRFVREIAEGDYVLTYDKAAREILIGIAAGPYEHRADLFPEHHQHVRAVRWLKRVSRDVFSAPARNSMGSVLTVFCLDDHLEEIHRAATETAVTQTIETEEIEEPPFYQETQAKADELIADLVSGLDPYEFQDLVAGVLRAMGFRAVSSSPGRDRGIDIIAHPDPFGFEQPVIKVQVKHRTSATGGPEMRSFIGALHSGESGLFVSTGGFTSDARQEAYGSHESLKLLDRDEFITMMLEHYEALDPEFKAKIPLRRVWVPAE